MILAGIIGTSENLVNITRSIRSIPDFSLVGFYTSNPDPSIHKMINPVLNYYRNPSDLIHASDVVIFYDHPGEYKELIHHVLKNSKHVFIFPDTTLSLLHLGSLVKLAEEAGVFLYLHHSGLNSRLKDLIVNHLGRPEFIDDYICLDQSSAYYRQHIFEALYRELFVIMKINPVNARKYFINSIPFCSADPHFVNVRIEFENGTSANVTINKYGGHNKSRLEVFRYDKKALVQPETGEIRISRRNKDIVHFPGNKKADSRREGLEIFMRYLSIGNFSSDPYETGVLAHRIAIEIIQQLIPVPEKTLF